MLLSLLPLSLLLSLVQGEQFSESIRIGELDTKQHGVSGEVFAVDESHIRIKDFNYDGAGPDAFFWIGWDGTPEQNDETKTAILAYPYKNKNYQYRDESAPVLALAKNEDVFLTLPEHVKTSDVKWISVWCRKFTVNFGDLMFPEDTIKFPEDSDSLPPPRIPPTSTTTQAPAVHHHDDESYAEPEPESEPEYHEFDHDHDPEAEAEPEDNEIDQPYNKPVHKRPYSGAVELAVGQLTLLMAALMALLH